MKRVLVTGIAGFVGSHLSELLAGKVELWGVHIDDRLENISGYLSGPDRINLIRCDLREAEAAASAVRKARPDVIVHLAAQSAPSISIKKPAETFKANLFATLNLFEAASAHAPDSVILNISSGDAYGNLPPEELPVTEEALLRPVNPYAVSKAAQDLLGYQYWASHGLKVVRCRPFNHIGPRQSEHFVASSFARQIAEIEAGAGSGGTGGKRTLRVGNLESAKDFLDVRDVVKAYALLMEKGTPGEAYNIASGRAVRIQEILDTLLSFSNVEIEVSQDPSRLRGREPAAVYGDSSKLKALGWSPEHRLADGLLALLEYWRARTVRS